jgi:two-component system response regulator
MPTSSPANDVLLVEDNQDDVDLTLRAFRKHAFPMNIHVVRDGQEALDFIFCKGAYSERDCVPPKVVLLDINLPKLDGLGVLKAVKNDPATKSIPVVMLTSSSERSDLQESYRLGANSYLVKPVDFKQFVDATRTFGEYWLEINRNAPN